MILNKASSDHLIRKKELNRMSEQVFTGISNLKDYLSQNDFKYYNIRDKSKAMGEFKYKVTKSEVLSAAKNYQEFSVFESLEEADKGIVLQGEVFIGNDFQMMATLSDTLNMSNREAMKSPSYNINCDLVHNTEPYIRGLTEVIDYICHKELIGMVVEFTLYETKVGVNNEELLIWELRNY